MWNQILLKLKESAFSVLPIALIIIGLSFSPLFNLSTKELITFSVCSLLLIIGIALFNLGAETAMSVMGEHTGSVLMKTKKIWLIFIVLFFMGVLITIAEPDLSVLANQVKNIISPLTLMISIGVGVGLFLVLAIVKIIFKQNLSMMIMFFYMMMFALTSLILSHEAGSFLPLAYDSGGVTTGPITVPFIMALGLGISNVVGGREAKENSFGLVALCSIGPILAVLILGLNVDPSRLDPANMFNLDSYVLGENVFYDFGKHMLHTLKNVGMALGLVVAFFLIIDIFLIRLHKKEMIHIFRGIILTFVGLVIFLTSAEVGYLSIGFNVGKQLATFSNNNFKYASTIFGFILGLVVVLAEPAVHVLTSQVESVTNGAIKKKTMLISLCIGVAISIALSVIRITFNFSILYYIIPGYLLSLVLSFFVPKMYTAIAFDSGGVASGPLTSSFILPFAIGSTVIFQGQEFLLQDAFGVVAMVALTPLITIQLLGFKAVVHNALSKRARTKKLITSDDEQIIDFM